MARTIKNWVFLCKSIFMGNFTLLRMLISFHTVMMIILKYFFVKRGQVIYKTSYQKASSPFKLQKELTKIDIHVTT